MSIGYIKNRNRAFIGCWPYAEEFFTASIMVSAMVMNWKLQRNGRCVVPMEQMITRLSAAEKLLFIDS